MLENNVCKNEFDDEEEIYLNLNDLVDLRESAEFKEASDSFEHYLDDYARVTRMPQSVCPISAIWLQTQREKQ